LGFDRALALRKLCGKLLYASPRRLAEQVIVYAWIFGIMMECEVKVWGDWQHITLEQALDLDPGHLKRCPECQGQVRLRQASIDGLVAHFEHYEQNPGCSLGDCFDGNPKSHPWPVR
jgi:hypothetical protein